jgi:hypothetical protein
MGETVYSTELVDNICKVISESEFGLRKIFNENDDFPTVTTFMRWLADKEDHSKDYLREQYARAKELQADYMAEKIIEIADESGNDTIQTDKGPIPNSALMNRSRLRVDVRKWLMSKLAPKKYGDKLELSGDPKAPLIPAGFNITFKTEEDQPENL